MESPLDRHIVTNPHVRDKDVLWQQHLRECSACRKAMTVMATETIERLRTETVDRASQRPCR
jgi:predicted anti-sigma-YlaC factor YlaD